jgi:hypothetical protein
MEKEQRDIFKCSMVGQLKRSNPMSFEASKEMINLFLIPLPSFDAFFSMKRLDNGRETSMIRGETFA